MHDFEFKAGELVCEGVKVSSIAQRVGTPFYLYSHKTLTDHFLKIQKAFAKLDPIICFAMKANGNMSVVKSLVDLGAGIDVVSIGELGKALLAGADPQKIVFASVGKTEEEISFAIETGILLFNVESEPELAEINRIAVKMGRKVQAALRINPDVPAPTHEYTNTGSLKKKFGIDLRTTRQIFQARKKYSHVKINGVHIHIGSQITSGAPFVAAIKKVVAFIGQLRVQGIKIEYLDIGGGMGIIYKGEDPQTAQEYADRVVPILEKTGLKIIMEPGRFIVGNAGIFVTRVLYVKDNGIKKFIIVDGGMNDLIRPMLYDAYHEIVPVVQNNGTKQKFDVVGPICESGDFFAHDRLLPVVKKGDLLAVMSAGAYGYVMSSNYNVRPRVPEVMVKGNRFKVVKERETFKDLVRGRDRHMVSIPFVKMVGAGNDFIIIEARPDFDYAQFARQACARQNGIGADGVLVLEKPAKSDYRMRIINADGSEAEMCGNGARCMAAYITANSKPAQVSFDMETLAGKISAQIQGDTVRVRLSDPKDYRPNLNITVGNQKLEVHYIDTGVPHTIVFVDGLQEVDANSLGKLVRHHPRFAPQGTNVDFVERAREGMVAVRTYERGVEAETLACGTGAVASALIAYLHAHPNAKKKKDASMKVLTASKEILEITFDLGEDKKIDNVWLKGSAKLIAKGEYYYHG